MNRYSVIAYGTVAAFKTFAVEAVTPDAARIEVERLAKMDGVHQEGWTVMDELTPDDRDTYDTEPVPTSAAVAFFASAGGQAFLKSVLDLRAATAGVDAEADLIVAKDAMDNALDLIAEAGVPVVIAPGQAAELSPASPFAEPIPTLEPGDIPALKAQGYAVASKGDGWAFHAPGGYVSPAYTMQTTAWLAAKRHEVEIGLIAG